MTATHPGHPILHFLNSVRDDGKQRRENSFDDAAGLLSLMQAAGLADADTPPPDPAQMPALLALREAAYTVLSAMTAARRRRTWRSSTMVGSANCSSNRAFCAVSRSITAWR